MILTGPSARIMRVSIKSTKLNIIFDAPKALSGKPILVPSSSLGQGSMIVTMTLPVPHAQAVYPAVQGEAPSPSLPQETGNIDRQSFRILQSASALLPVASERPPSGSENHPTPTSPDGVDFHEMISLPSFGQSTVSRRSTLFDVDLLSYLFFSMDL